MIGCAVTLFRPRQPRRRRRDDCFDIRALTLSRRPQSVFSSRTLLPKLRSKPVLRGRQIRPIFAAIFFAPQRECALLGSPADCNAPLLGLVDFRALGAFEDQMTQSNSLLNSSRVFVRSREFLRFRLETFGNPRRSCILGPETYRNDQKPPYGFLAIIGQLSSVERCLAAGRGIEPPNGRIKSSPRPFCETQAATILLRIDWHSSPNRALLW
jgi:hypothetical protein